MSDAVFRKDWSDEEFGAWVQEDLRAVVRGEAGNEAVALAEGEARGYDPDDLRARYRKARPKKKLGGEQTGIKEPLPAEVMEKLRAGNDWHELLGVCKAACLSLEEAERVAVEAGWPQGGVAEWWDEAPAEAKKIYGSNAHGEQKAKPEPAVALPAVLPPLPPPLPLDGLDKALWEMNERHAVIDNLGGKAVIASYELTPEHQYRWVFQTKESFLLIYSNQWVTLEIGPGRSLTLPRAQWWLGHRERKQYRTVVFAPGSDRVVHGCLNLWQGWGIEPKPGDWSLIRRHIEEVLAAGKPEYGEYIIRWIAWAIQNPHRQAEVALVLIGAKGTGKGTLVRCLEMVFGAHAFQVTGREEVIGKFNGHLQDCILFVADEAYWGGDKRCVGRLQGMITEKKLPIERKGIDLIQVPNMLHILMLAEPGWVIPAGPYERRYAASAVSKVHRGDRAYFKALHDQIEKGGAAAMFWDLGKLDLEGWHPREIPEGMLTNPELQKQQAFNLPPLEQWYVMILHNARVPGGLLGKPSTAFSECLLEDARRAAPRLRELTAVALRNFLTDEEKLGVACDKYRAASRNGWTFPPLEEARRAWEEKYGPVAWDNPAVEWQKR